MKKLLNAEISDQIDQMLKKQIAYVNSRCMRENEIIALCSKRLGVSHSVVYKLKNGIAVTLNSQIRVLYASGQLDSDCVAYLLNSLVSGFVPEHRFVFDVTECKSEEIPTWEYTSIGQVISLVHKLSQKIQVDIAESLGFSRSFIQNLANDRATQSIESVCAIFWYYYKILQPDFPLQLVENFLNLLCVKMFPPDKYFRVKVVAE